MPVTLAQASLNAASDIDRNIIDEFRKSSFLLNALPFDQSVNPAGGGSTLTYGYTRQVTQRSAAFRAINAEYTPAEVTKAQYTVGLKPLGGSFQIDRVLTGIGAVSEVSFQLAQLIKATKAYFADQVINGDSAVTTDGFDGLSKALRNSSTEVAGPVLDLAGVNTQALAIAAVGRINAWLALMDGSARRPAHEQHRQGDPLDGRGVLRPAPLRLRTCSGSSRRRSAASRSSTSARRQGPRRSSSAARPPAPTRCRRSPRPARSRAARSRISFQGQTTAAIAYGETAANIITALNLLSNVDSGDITATGGPAGTSDVVFTFAGGGRYAGTNVPLMVVNGAALTGGGSYAIAETTPGAYSANPGGLTDLYAVRFGLDGFHGVSVPGQLINTWLPGLLDGRRRQDRRGRDGPGGGGPQGHQGRRGPPQRQGRLTVPTTRPLPATAAADGRTVQEGT